MPIGGVRGRPLSRPARVYTDRGYDHDKYRRILHERNIPPVSRGVVSRTVVALEKSVGSSKVLMLGCIISAVYVFALNVAPTFMKRSSNSAVA